MTNFEKITQSPEALGEFLSSLPVLEGPWDEEFQRNYCAGCGRVNCDAGRGCPYKKQWNSPAWWLRLEAKTDAGQ